MPILSLPEHPSASVGQSLFSCDNPTQSSPPFAGGGLVQVLVRVLDPWRQRVGSVHVVQAVQAVNTPSTAPSKKTSPQLVFYAKYHSLSLCFDIVLYFKLSSRGSVFIKIIYSLLILFTLYLSLSLPEWDWNIRLGGERICTQRTYHHRSHNRGRRP